MRDIKEFNLGELREFLVSCGEQGFRADQIFSWIYERGAKEFSQMSDLSLGLRKKLEENFSFSSLKLATALKSADGTKKFLFLLEDKNYVEAVIIPTEKRLTGCISSQVGCKFACRFCASGIKGFKRDLSSAEMVEEALFLRGSSPEKRLTHLVFMGTGEPLDNYANVLKAVRIINCPRGLNIGARRITISTSGVIPGIKQLAQEGLQIELSVSLHAADNQKRDLIMPVNKKYPLQELIHACKEYIRQTNRQVTFEYILIKGLNSDLQSARKLGTILRGMNCKVNLIPANPVRNYGETKKRFDVSNGANPVKELKVEPPEKSEILFFKDALLKSGINVTLRRSRGADIDAACGQLRLGYGKD